MLHTEGGRCCRSDGARFALDRSNEGPAIFGPLDLIRKAAGRGCERADGSELTVRSDRVEQDTARGLLPRGADSRHGKQTLIRRDTRGHIRARSANVCHVHERALSRLVMFGVDDLASEVTIPGQSTYRVARLRPPPTQGVIYTCTRPVSPTTRV